MDEFDRLLIEIMVIVWLKRAAIVLVPLAFIVLVAWIVAHFALHWII